MEAAVLDPEYWKTFLLQSAAALKQQTVHLDPLDPWFSLILFIAASVVMIWRLEALEKKGFEGTVLGTLVMPYDIEDKKIKVMVEAAHEFGLYN